jgi:hypothetical protein
VRGLKHPPEIFDSFHHIGFGGAISAKNLGQLGVLPVGDIVVFSIFAKDSPFDGVAVVVDHEDKWSQVVAQNRRDLLGGKLKRTFARE